MTAPPQDVLTQGLATYGALLASIVFGWNLYRDVRDRAKLKVSATISRITQDVQGNWIAITSAVRVPAHAAPQQRFVVMTAVNVGRRPLVWIGWGGDYRKGARFRKGARSFGIMDSAIKNHLPKKLEEGDTHSACIELEADWDDVKSFFMWDASGKHWKLPGSQLKKLKREAREALNGTASSG
jgi:hypothetical protein